MLSNPAGCSVSQSPLCLAHQHGLLLCALSKFQSISRGRGGEGRNFPVARNVLWESCWQASFWEVSEKSQSPREMPFQRSALL